MKGYKDMFRQAKKMQSEMQRIQEELASEKVEATAGGGAVKVVASGRQEILEIKIEPSAADPSDVSMLEEMLLVAINDALSKSSDLANKRLEHLTSGLSIPGLM